jgi:hypothetical protein
MFPVDLGYLGCNRTGHPLGYILALGNIGGPGSRVNIQEALLHVASILSSR